MAPDKEPKKPKEPPLITWWEWVLFLAVAGSGFWWIMKYVVIR